jgi:hypothetical protein
MIKRFSIVLLAALAAGLAPAQETNSARPELWFPVGEGLSYRIFWGMIPVGHVRVTTEWVEEDGRTLVAIRMLTRTGDFLSKLYPVDDFVETLIDPAAFLPVRFSKKLREGRYRCDEVTNFDHANRVAHWRSNLNGKSKDIPIEPETRDLVSYMYHMRLKRFEPGTKNQYRVMADEKLYDLEVTAGKLESFRVGDYGWVSSVKLEPQASFAGLFVRKGRMWMWVSEDERRIATKLVARVPVGSVSVLLVGVDGPGDDAWVRPGLGDHPEMKESKP